MGSEGSWMLDFPLSPSSLYFLLQSHSQWSLFPKERKMHKDNSCIVTRDCSNEETKPHSKLVFSFGFLKKFLSY